MYITRAEQKVFNRDVTPVNPHEKQMCQAKT